MNNDPIANLLSNMLNAEKIGKKSIAVKPYSNLIGNVLTLLKEHKYIKEYTVEDDHKGGIITVQLHGSINKCGVIKPRFSIKASNIQKAEERYLPAKDMGIIIITTPQGIMTHYQAKEKNIGGKLLAYCY